MNYNLPDSGTIRMTGGLPEGQKKGNAFLYLRRQFPDQEGNLLMGTRKEKNYPDGSGSPEPFLKEKSTSRDALLKENGF